jgi:hypothetical protein
MVRVSTDVRRGAALALCCCLLLAGGGCLTLSPTVTGGTDGANGTDGAGGVFERVSTDEPWGARSVSATVRLASNASTAAGVTQLVVVDGGGERFDSVAVGAGQTRATVYLPPNGDATLLAVNGVNGTVAGRTAVTTAGRTVPALGPVPRESAVSRGP